MVTSLVAKELTTGGCKPIWPRFTAATRETISKITDRVLDELVGWQNRPLIGCNPRCS
jgi:hypothetical protein